MNDSILPATINLGFLTVFAEATGYVGGYLVTNSWGRPLEFRLSTAVQPNKVQQILYGSTLTEYLSAELIGKTLIEKTATPIHVLITDSLTVLPIRTRLEIPTAAVIAEEAMPPFSPEKPLTTFTHPRAAMPLVVESRFASDEGTLRAILNRVDSALELTEPFARIREAMGEARKMGVTSRAA